MTTIEKLKEELEAASSPESLQGKFEAGLYFRTPHYAKLLLEAISVIEFYGDESSWQYSGPGTYNLIRNKDLDKFTDIVGDYFMAGQSARNFLEKIGGGE